MSASISTRSGLRPTSDASRILEDLVKPAYRGLTVVQNPATSSPGLAFLLATVGHFGEDGYLDFWRQLRDNDVWWSTAGRMPTGASSAAPRGDRPIVVSYATSPPAEVHFAEKPPDRSPHGSGPRCRVRFRQIEFVGILKGTRQRTWPANWWISCWTELSGRYSACTCSCFPPSRTRALPDVFRRHTGHGRTAGDAAPEEIERS